MEEAQQFVRQAWWLQSTVESLFASSTCRIEFANTPRHLPTLSEHQTGTVETLVVAVLSVICTGTLLWSDIEFYFHILWTVHRDTLA
jgi:hypothetical protein